VDMRKAVDSGFWHLDKLGSLVCLFRSNPIDYDEFWSLKYDSFLGYAGGPPWLELDFGRRGPI
jgi:hypothetical protein